MTMQATPAQAARFAYREALRKAKADLDERIVPERKRAEAANQRVWDEYQARIVPHLRTFQGAADFARAEFVLAYVESGYTVAEANSVAATVERGRLNADG